MTRVVVGIVTRTNFYNSTLEVLIIWIFEEFLKI